MATNKSKVTRRKFIKGGAVAAGAGAATLAMPNVSRAQTKTLKMQSSWGSTSPFQDMAKQYIERVTAMAGGPRTVTSRSPRSPSEPSLGIP